jgi:6-pyruvoyltetrahydropterin/6-carboxytetrahydropterin synthase
MEIAVDGWAIGARFASCHIIPRHPKCGRLHGHTYAAHARFRGEAVPPMELMLDFSDVKRAMREVCDELDHHVLVPARHPDVRVREAGGNYELGILGKRYSLPREDVLLLPVTACTAERLAEWFLGELLMRLELPPNVGSVSVGIDEGQGQGAWATRELGGRRAAARAVAGGSGPRGVKGIGKARAKGRGGSEGKGVRRR